MKIYNFLIIQTAFLGDVILATSLIESIHQKYPEAKIDFLLRKGNESLFDNHPYINDVLILDRKSKLKSLPNIIFSVRKAKYDVVVNAHRFGSSGLITSLSGAKYKFGFSKNPFSFCYTKSYEHNIGNGEHEIKRNHQLISSITDSHVEKPKLYPSESDFEKVKQEVEYVVMAPASVWFTKQLPVDKWIELINNQPKDIEVKLIGAPSDKNFCDEIINQTNRKEAENLAGKLSLLQSAALMKNARMNFVNDSAPLHLCASVNAPVTAFFCSTVPEFGFGPLSDNSKLIQIEEKLDCRPCGLHGHNECPKGHFKCGNLINVDGL